MKVQLQLISCVMILLTLILSCNKNDEVITVLPLPPSGLPTLQTSNDVNFWIKHWDTSSRGYEIHLNIQRLTQEQVNKGIDVNIAVLGADNTPWVRIPVNYIDGFLTDTVRLSYAVIPGQLQIIAKTSCPMNNYQSDIFLEYK